MKVYNPVANFGTHPLKNKNNQNSNWKNYWDLETCRKSQKILYTYKDAFNRVSKILLGKSHCASSKYCSTRHPIVQSENPAINLNWVKIRHTTDLIPQVESPIVHHPGGGGSGDGGARSGGGVFGKLARIINFSCYNQDCAIWQPTSEQPSIKARLLPKKRTPHHYTVASNGKNRPQNKVDLL